MGRSNLKTNVISEAVKPACPTAGIATLITLVFCLYNNMSHGWISLNRKIKDHWLYKERRIFSKYEAWIDMLFMASHSSHKLVHDGKLIYQKEGEFITSEIKLMEKWRWSKSKTRAFLALLEQDEMISKKSDKKKTTILILNYAKYQNYEPQKDHRKTTERPLKDTINNENNENKGKPLSSAEAEADKGVNKVIDIFYQLNKAINYANASYRKSCKTLIEKYGVEKTTAAAVYALSVQTERFAPRIANPTQLLNKFGELIIYKQNETANKPFANQSYEQPYKF